MKKTSLIVALAMVAPLAAQAETINIYGWQNHSFEMVDQQSNGREFTRIQSNAGNIGFAASVDTGMNGIMVNFRCEQFTYFNHFGGGTGWCNRNSKIGLAHPMAGEIMFATWLLPYNEGVAQWVDPFYDAGADSHTSIMGSVGAHTIFYNTGDFDQQASASGPATNWAGQNPNDVNKLEVGLPEFNYAGGGYDTGFNRRQENIIQYWSPNWNGFVFRFAWTAGNRDDTSVTVGDASSRIDPIIRSSSLAYENGPLWLAVTWQDHEDWTAQSIGCNADADADTAATHCMTGSDAESYRLAGRYIMDMGGGASFQVSAMWESLEYKFNGTAGATADNPDTANVNEADSTTGIRNAMGAFGYGNFGTYMGGADLNNGNITFERDAWMVSGKIKFGGPLDVRFSYMDADDLEISCGMCSGDWQDTAADAFNVGLFYTMPAGTELRLTYSEVNNDDQGTYGQGISGTGLGTAGEEVEMVAVGIVHWFD